MTYLLGIDTSTTATKALLIDEEGSVVAVAATEYPFDSPKPGWTEQAPALFWNGTVQSIRAVFEKAKISGKEVVAIGLTGQMHGMTLLDAHGEVIRPCILWNDQRTAAQCEFITNLIGAERVLQLTGNPILTGFTAPKIVWTREHEPENYRRVAHILLPKDYVRYQLTGECFSDVADSSGTSLFDVGKRRWSEEMLYALHIPRAWLPEVTESPVASTKINAAAAQATGLLAGTPVVAGGGDQAAQAVGTGIVAEGAVAVTIGTSGVVFAQSDSYRVEPQGRLHAFCHAVPGKWHLMGVMLSAGGSFRWYRDALAAKESYDALMQGVATVAAGSEGLLFLPYLTGERTPHPDPHARGAFIGLNIRHAQPHLARAVIEGVTFGLRDSLELMRGLGVPTQQVRASGGGAKSAIWRQILADVFNAEIVTVNSTEGAAHGAALLAGVGAGIYPSVEAAADQAIRITGTHQPTPEVNVYAKYYARYQALYPALKTEFAALAEMAGS
ncbi:MAG: Xylulose kinase [bacterium]|nr:Xylulose kinase [bacterium]